MKHIDYRDIGLGVRAINCLRNLDIEKFSELSKFKRSDLLVTPNFGRKSLQEIEVAMKERGVLFYGELKYYCPNHKIVQIMFCPETSDNIESIFALDSEGNLLEKDLVYGTGYHWKVIIPNSKERNPNADN